MGGWGVIPAIRVRDMAAALAFYTDGLGFVVERGGPADANCSLSRGDARLMLETAGDLYSAPYNEAIRSRLGSVSPNALYVEAADLEVLYARITASGMDVVDPLADRPWGQAEFTIADPDGQWITFWRATTSGG